MNIVALLLLLPIQTDDLEKQIAELEKRIAAQEERIAVLEEKLSFLQLKAAPKPVAGIPNLRVRIAELDTEIEKNPANPEFYRERAECRLRLEERDRALKDTKRAIRLDPRAPEGYELRARVLMSLRNFLGAEDDAKRAIEFDPRHVNAMIVLARLKEKRADAAGGIRILDRAVKVAPDNPELYWWRGKIRLNAGAPRDALDDFRRTLKLNPAHGEVRVYMALSYDGLGETDKALKLLERFIQQNPKNWLGYRWRGRILGIRGRYTEAVRDLQKAIDVGAPEARELQREIARYRIELEERKK